MKKVYGKELLLLIEAEKENYKKRMAEREKQVNDCWFDYDDCFMSDKIDSQGVDRCNQEIAILKGDGLMDYDTIVDEKGNEVYIHDFKNKWGGYSYVCNGIFASSIKALLKKTGYVKKTIKVPAWVKFISVGSGMCGVYCGYYATVRWHTNMVTGEYVGYPD